MFDTLGQVRLKSRNRHSLILGNNILVLRSYGGGETLKLCLYLFLWFDRRGLVIVAALWQAIFVQVRLRILHVHLSLCSMHQLKLYLLVKPLVRIDIQAKMIPRRIDEILCLLLLRLWRARFIE